MTQLSHVSGNVIPLRPPARWPARRPEALDLARMRARHGWVIGTMQVWRARVRARSDLQRLLLRADDRLLEDAGICRREAACEVRRWFWQEMLALGPGGSCP